MYGVRQVQSNNYKNYLTYYLYSDNLSPSQHGSRVVQPREVRMKGFAASALLLAVASSLGFVRSTVSAHPATALDDATIVAIFDAANTADIETGKLGAERARNKEVKDFGTMLGNVHTAVRQQGRDLAKKLGVTPTPPKDDQGAKDHAAAMAK